MSASRKIADEEASVLLYIYVHPETLPYISARGIVQRQQEDDDNRRDELMLSRATSACRM